MRFVSTAVTALVAVAVVAGCSSNSMGSDSGGHTTALTVSNDIFNPSPDTVPAGQVTFSWVNASNSHNVTWLTGPGTLPASSSTMTSGTYNATLVQGTYTYHCTIHANMNGTIVVQ